MAPVHCAAGSDGETNFGVTSLAAPKAASSRVARYSCMARLAVSGSHVFFHSEPGLRRSQAPIHGKSFSANQIGRNTRLDHTLKYTAKNVAVAEALIAGPRER